MFTECFRFDRIHSSPFLIRTIKIFSAYTPDELWSNRFARSMGVFGNSKHLTSGAFGIKLNFQWRGMPVMQSLSTDAGPSEIR